jgi:outer membrane protein assembly factor BamB
MSRSSAALSLLLLILPAAPGACRDGTSPSGSGIPTVAWRAALPVDPQQIWIGRPAADPTRTIIEAGNQLFALEAATGALLWQHRVRIAPDPPTTFPLIDAGRVYLAEVDSTFALDAATGATIWTFHPDSSGVVVPAIDATTIYIGQRGIPSVYALDKATGALRWRTNLGVGYSLGAVVRGFAVRGDTVYATVWRDKAPNGFLSSGVLVALAASDGHEFWRFETPGDHGSFVTAPLLLPDVVIINDFAGDAVLAIDPLTQSVRWRTTVTNAYLVYGNGTLYGAGADGHVYAMNPSTGAVQWSTALPSSAGGLALCGNSLWENSGNLHRVDAATGAERGVLAASGLGTFASDVGTSGQRVFVAGGNLVTAVACDQ